MTAKKQEVNGERDVAFSFLREFIRNAATTRLSSCVKDYQVEIREIGDDEDFSYDHWIAAIVISATTIRVNFRVHFTTKAAREFVAMNQVLKNATDPNISHDFVREYCNLTAGAIKRGLDHVNSDGGGYIVNLPYQTPAFDNVTNLSKGVDRDLVKDCWAYRLNGQELICVTEIEVLDWRLIGGLTDVDMSSLIVTDDGLVEFL
jgi:hypothetical protein